MTERHIPDDELITGSIADDLQTASEEGSRDDIMAVLEKYDTEQVFEVGSDTYYRLPTRGPNDPEVAVLYSNGTVEVKDFTEFIRNVGPDMLSDMSYEDVLGMDITSQIEDDLYWEGGVVYHTTTVESAVDVIEAGVLEARNETRGLSNRSTGSAVFASEMHPDSTYGEVVFEIDIDAMVRDGFKPTLGREQPVEEAIADEAIASMFYIPDYYAEVEQGISRDTVVIYADVPLKYVSLDVGATVAEELRDQLSETAIQSVDGL